MFITVLRLSVFGEVLLYKEGPAGARTGLRPLLHGEAEPRE